MHGINTCSVLRLLVQQCTHSLGGQLAEQYRSRVGLPAVLCYCPPHPVSCSEPLMQ